MIRLLFAVLLGLSSANILNGQDVQQADSHYRDGEYEQALELYDKALQQAGADRGSLHYNLGNCAYRLERYPQALYQYRCAELYMPHNGDLMANLRLARDKLGIQPVEIESFTGLLLAMVDWFTAGELLILISLLESVGLVGFVLMRGNSSGRVVMILVVLLALLLAARLIKTEYYSGPQKGMVLATQVALRAEPHRSVPVLFELRAGESLQVAEQSERWARVLHARGEGWTQVDGIGLIR